MIFVSKCTFKLRENVKTIYLVHTNTWYEVEVINITLQKVLEFMLQFTQLEADNRQ